MGSTMKNLALLLSLGLAGVHAVEDLSRTSESSSTTSSRSSSSHGHNSTTSSHTYTRSSTHSHSSTTTTGSSLHIKTSKTSSRLSSSASSSSLVRSRPRITRSYDTTSNSRASPSSSPSSYSKTSTSPGQGNSTITGSSTSSVTGHSPLAHVVITTSSTYRGASKSSGSPSDPSSLPTTHSTYRSTNTTISNHSSWNPIDATQWTPNFTPTITDAWFSESPQCTSDLLSYYNLTAIPTDPRDKYTWTVPAGQTLTTTIKPTKYNSRVFTIAGPTTTVYADSNWPETDGPEGGCCGACSITAYDVDLHYWPQPGAKTDCQETLIQTLNYQRESNSRSVVNTGNIPIPYPGEPAVTPRALLPRMVRRDLGNETGEMGIAIGEDGFTYTSPYMYLVYKEIWANNKCGAVGGAYTSLTWSFLPGQLSSVDNVGYTRSFNETDLPCRPQTSLHHDGYYHPATIAAVPQLNLVDPAYKDCWVGYWQGLDPPFAFSQANNFFATTTEPSSPTPTPPQPESKATSTPRPTSPPKSPNLPAKSNPQPDPPKTVHFSVPTKANVAHSTPSTTAPYHTVTPLVPPPVIVASHVASFDTSSSALIVGHHTLHASDSPATIASTPVFVSSTPAHIAIGSSNFFFPSTPAPAPIIGAGHTITPQDGNFVVAGHTLTPGGSAVTIDHTPFSIAPVGASSAVAIIGGSTVPLGAVHTPAPLTIAGQTLTPSDGNFVLSGHTITPGGPAVTISGHRFSIEAGGLVAHIGTSTIPFGAVGSASSFAAAGRHFTATGDGYAVNGHLLKAGGRAYTIDGTKISVGFDLATTTYADGKVATVTPNGEEPYLVVGGKTFHMHAAKPTPTDDLGGALGTAVVTIGGAKFTPLADGKGVVYEGHTLTEGEKFTRSGVVGRIGHGEVVWGLSTIEEKGAKTATDAGKTTGSSASTSTTAGVGDYVFSGMYSGGASAPTGAEGKAAATTGTADGAKQTGEAMRTTVGITGILGGVGFLVFVMGL